MQEPDAELTTDENGVIELDFSELALGRHRIQYDDPPHRPKDPRRARARAAAQELRMAQAHTAIQMADITQTLLDLAANREVLVGLTGRLELVFSATQGPLGNLLLAELARHPGPVEASALIAAADRPRPSVNRAVRALPESMVVRHGPKSGPGVAWELTPSARDWVRTFLWRPPVRGPVLLGGRPVGDATAEYVRRLMRRQMNDMKAARGSRPAAWTNATRRQ